MTVLNTADWLLGCSSPPPAAGSKDYGTEVHACEIKVNDLKCRNGNWLTYLRLVHDIRCFVLVFGGGARIAVFVRLQCLDMLRLQGSHLKTHEADFQRFGKSPCMTFLKSWFGYLKSHTQKVKIGTLHTAFAPKTGSYGSLLPRACMTVCGGTSARFFFFFFLTQIFSCFPPVKTEPMNNSDTATTTGDTVLDTYTGSGNTQTHTHRSVRKWTHAQFFIGRKKEKLKKNKKKQSPMSALVSSATHKHHHPSRLSGGPVESFNPMKHCLSLDYVIKAWHRGERQGRGRGGGSGGVLTNVFSYLDAHAPTGRAVVKQRGVCQCCGLTSQWPQTLCFTTRPARRGPRGLQCWLTGGGRGTSAPLNLKELETIFFFRKPDLDVFFLIVVLFV